MAQTIYGWVMNQENGSYVPSRIMNQNRIEANK